VSSRTRPSGESTLAQPTALAPCCDHRTRGRKNAGALVRSVRGRARPGHRLRRSRGAGYPAAHRPLQRGDLGFGVSARQRLSDRPRRSLGSRGIPRSDRALRKASVAVLAESRARRALDSAGRRGRSLACGGPVSRSLGATGLASSALCASRVARHSRAIGPLAHMREASISNRVLRACRLSSLSADAAKLSASVWGAVAAEPCAFPAPSTVKALGRR